ncbi:hypothetical protein ATKI12_5208 [Kitasatospora sp. Ki12]|uniref:nuclear transport factor 2 family protein n=1 Tax=Kitasatospora xanthocidica TaxID=83382 RepID=UPI0016734131|nr:nuclear transport factor 2 family protein [Kitasatospora xanthocidica]GHF89467.1 hypothetical protein GCM10018790_78440 [Kitasatospora xanthocidica]
MTAHDATALTDTDTYLRVQHFYARQMRLLDTGATDDWAATFAEDGVFAANGLPAPVRGRGNIAAAAKEASRRLAEAGVVHRHWVGMLTTEPAEDGLLRATCYALVLEVPRGGEATVHRSTVCVDLLAPAGGGWVVVDRRVTRDDLA